MKPEVMLEVQTVAFDILYLARKFFTIIFSCLFCYKENLKAPLSSEYTEDFDDGS
jgi:hypothetical protein